MPNRRPDRLHDTGNGCIIEHNRSSANRIHVRSSGDRFDQNGLGCIIGGRLVAAPGVANSNSTVSKQIDVDVINSSPVDPTGTNTVTVVR